MSEVADISELAKTCFILGIRVAENVHGIRRKPNDPTQDAIFDTLKAVASGEITVIDTPEEVAAKLPEALRPPTGVMQAGLQKGRENQRIAAQMILSALPK